MKSLLLSRWSEIRPLFEAALDQPIAERDDWIQAATPDPSLRDAVRALLLQEAQLESAEDLPLPEPQAEAAAEPIPAVLGGYRVLRELGRGGMGVVFLAEQATPRRQVAIKRLTRAADPATRERFRREAELLAQLAHPGIARIIQVEADADGQPLLVMEYVEGETLGALAPRLAREARLALLASIADAVEHAHGRGIVHRDLKPANILVTPDGQPKILDFGIGRALLGEGATLTETGMLLGTPAYMAPEQALGEAGVDARADVWALGVIGYELLADRLPLPVSGLTPLQALKVVAGDTPPPLSRLDRSLRGDLEVIVETALAKSPPLRYASAGLFADDLRRYLAAEPIRARRPSAWRRAVLFARRKPAQVAALAVALGGVLIGSGLALSFAFDEAQARARALKEAQISTEVRRMLTELFAAADPWQAQGREMSVRELLDQGRHRVLVSLEKSPEVRAQLLLDMGRIYRNLGVYPVAIESLTAALSGSVSVQHRARALTERASAHSGAGDFEAALRDAQAALHLLPPEIDAARVAATVALAVAQSSSDHLDQAAHTIERVLTALQQQPPGHERDALLSLLHTALADVRRKQARWDEAELSMRTGIAMSAATANDPQRGIDLVDLALILGALARYEEAQEVLQEAIAAHTRLLGPTHPLTMRARGERALSLQRLANYVEANQEFLEVIAGLTQSLGAEHPTTALAQHNFSTALYAQGEYAKAKDFASTALAVAERNFPAGHERINSARTVIAACMLELGEAAAAVPILEANLHHVRTRGVASDLPSAANTLALAYIAIGRADAALALSAEVLRVEASLPDFQPRNSYWTQVIEARAEFADGRIEQALSSQQRILEGYNRDYPGNLGLRSASLMIDLAASLTALRRDPEQARALVAEALAIRSQKLGPQHPSTQAARQMLDALAIGNLE